LLPGWIRQERSAILLTGGVLSILLVGWWVSSLFGGAERAHTTLQAQVPSSTPTPFQPVPLTQTPFRPFAPTPTTTPTPLPTPIPIPSTYKRFGIDFSDTAQAIKVIFSPSQTLNNGHTIRISFRPGWPCEWINHRGCTSLHYQGRVVLVTIHSGVAGDGQPLRSALEGTWLDSAALPLSQVRENLAALQSAAVSFSQSGKNTAGMHVLAAARVPAAQVQEYFSLPVNDGLELAAQSSAEMAAALASDKPLLVIETCGWHHPEEPYAAGTTATSASVYLVVIGD
jgi:hypothetical protein